MRPDEIESYIQQNLPFVSRETFLTLQDFEKLVRKWQSSINLVADVNQLWPRHMFDSLQLYPLLPSPPYTLADLGSGAGFPGLILAIAGAKNITLIESDKRKAAFLQEAIRQFAPRTKIYSTRIETITEPFDIITSRACASVERLLSISHALWKPATIGIFLKGKRYEDELLHARKHWKFQDAITPSITSDEGVIVKLTSVRPRDENLLLD